MHTKSRWGDAHDSCIEEVHVPESGRSGPVGPFAGERTRSFVIGHLAGISHFASMALYAVLVSIALACLTQRSTSERVRYAAVTFSLFIVMGVGIAWLMYPLSR
jgi:hypothetical protein